MNWRDLIPMFGQVGRFLIAYLLYVYMFLNFGFFHISEYGNILVQFLSLLYGGLIFSIFVKPIKVVRWKKIIRVFSILIIFSFMITVNLKIKDPLLILFFLYGNGRVLFGDLYNFIS